MNLGCWLEILATTDSSQLNRSSDTSTSRRDRKQQNGSDVGSIKAYIRKEGGKHCVKSEKGKNMGCYDSEEGAKKRLGQIEYFKHKG